jgi:SAM-dependent methyltransferase
MSHPEQRNFLGLCRLHFTQWFQGKTGLEVGSLNVNGTARDYFAGCHYVGIDVGPGAGVDIVERGDRFAAPSASFDVVISCEAFEHDPDWQATFVNCVRLLRPNGIFIVTCATYGRQQHGTCASQPEASPHTSNSDTVAYYRNLGEQDFLSLPGFGTWFGWYGFFVDHVARDIYFLAFGKDARPYQEVLDGFTSDVGSMLYRKNVLGEW